ncbi:MAG TPA: MFS transporter [Geobacterales bacterium]|nr:MFS transporter [Geobacterales bacterium]
MAEPRRIYPVLAFLAFASVIDTALVSPILTNYAHSLGASEAIAGFIVGLYSIIAIIVSFPLGYLIDRLGRKNAILIAVPGDIIAFVIYFLAPNYTYLIIARIINAFFDAIIFPTALAFIGDQFARRGYPLSIFYTLVSLSIIVGAGSSSVITLSQGFRYVFIVSIVIHVILFSLVYFTAFKDIKRAKIGDSIKQVRANLRFLISASLTMFSIYMFIGTIAGSLGNALRIVLNIADQIAAAQVGIFLAITSLIGIPFFFMTSYICEKKTPLLTLFSASLIGLIASIALFENIYSYLYVVAPLLGIALAMAYLSSSYVVTSVGGEGRGTASGILQIFNLSGVALGASISGYILNLWGPSYPFILPAIPLSISALLALFIMLAQRSRLE